MAQSLNKASIIGNLGNDPVIRYINQDLIVANFNIATSEKYTDQNTGKTREQTEWHNITCWNGLAKIAESYLKKGDKVYVEGRLRTSQYNDKEEIVRHKTEIIVSNIIMLNTKKESKKANNNYPPTIEKEKTFTQTDIEQSDNDLPF
jgi:single-strand DNA-binding protein